MDMFGNDFCIYFTILFLLSFQSDVEYNPLSYLGAGNWRSFHWVHLKQLTYTSEFSPVENQADKVTIWNVQKHIGQSNEAYRFTDLKIYRFAGISEA